jgi:hypothetical protein
MERMGGWEIRRSSMTEVLDELITKLKFEVDELKRHAEGYIDGVISAKEYYLKTLTTVDEITADLQEVFRLGNGCS